MSRALSPGAPSAGQRDTRLAADPAPLHADAAPQPGACLWRPSETRLHTKPARASEAPGAQPETNPPTGALQSPRPSRPGHLAFPSPLHGKHSSRWNQHLLPPESPLADPTSADRWERGTPPERSELQVWPPQPSRQQLESCRLT